MDFQTYGDDSDEPPKKKLRFNVWNYFVKIDKNGKEMCECMTCGRLFTCGGRSGISHLNQHIVGHFKLKKFDHNLFRESTTRMIIEHNLAFCSVEWDKFREFTKFVSHDEAHWFSRYVVANDVMKIYLLEKEKLKKQMAEIEGSVCLSVRCWTCSTSGRSYVTLAAHFMDEKWSLVVKLLNFCHLDPSRDHFELSRKVIGCLQEWGIEKNIFSITMDNASANDDDFQSMKNQHRTLDSLLKTFVTSATPTSLEKHFKCCAPVLDLMVQESLKVVSDLLDKIRKSLKYVSMSNSRLKQFYQCVQEAGCGDDSDGLCLDVSGKWVSSYMMLMSAIKYRGAFELMYLKDSTYNHCPSSEEWGRGEEICAFLKIFYGLTKIVSQSTYPSSETHLKKIAGIEFSLKNMMLSEDEKIRDMASKMSDEYDKYLSEYSMILAFSCVLNPCLKFEFLEFAYKKSVDDMEVVKDKVNNVRKALYTLFNEYAKKVPSTSRSFSLTNSRSYKTSFERLLYKREMEFRVYLENKKRKKYAGGVTQLDLYLKETNTHYKNPLDYWKYFGHKYDIIERMARDLFSIPIITVASESAFSPGSCILNKYRNCMVSENLQALVCSHNWLYGFSPSDQFGDVIEETRQIGLNLSKQDSECHCSDENKSED